MHIIICLSAYTINKWKGETENNDARALINQSIKSNQGILQRNDTFSSFLIPKISGDKQKQLEPRKTVV